MLVLGPNLLINISNIILGSLMFGLLYFMLIRRWCLGLCPFLTLSRLGFLEFTSLFQIIITWWLKCDSLVHAMNHTKMGRVVGFQCIYVLLTKGIARK